MKLLIGLKNNGGRKMSKIKQILLIYDDKSVKGYNLNSFIARFRDTLQSKLEELGV